MKRVLYSHFTPLCRVWILCVALAVIAATIWTNASLWLLIACYVFLGLLPPALFTLNVRNEQRAALEALKGGNPEPLYRFTSLFKNPSLDITMNHALSLYELGKKKQAFETLRAAEPKHFKNRIQAVGYYHNLCLFSENLDDMRLYFEKEKTALSLLDNRKFFAYKERLLKMAQAHLLCAEGKYEQTLTILNGILENYPKSYPFLLLKAKCLLAIEKDPTEAKEILSYIFFHAPCMAAGREAETLLSTLE